MVRYEYYCLLCWQEFDHPAQHGTGSWFNGKRLDRPCPGDIRRTPLHEVKKRVPKEPMPLLDLGQGEPIKLEEGGDVEMMEHGTACQCVRCRSFT